MLFALVECREHDRNDRACIVTDQTNYILVIPEIQGPLRNLNTWQEIQDKITTSTGSASVQYTASWDGQRAIPRQQTNLYHL